MGPETGIIFAFGALLFWGFGDFLIQRSTRKFGDWETLFIVTLFGAAITTPFVYAGLPSLFSFEDGSLLVLTTVSVVLLVAALLDFEALREGKIAVIEPIYALEVPIAAILAFTIVSEGLGLAEIALITVLVTGLMLVSLKSHHLSRKRWVEKGALLALLGSLFMGSSNFLVGFASRVTTPFMTNWFLNVFIALVCLSYIVGKGRLGRLERHVRDNTRLIFTVSAFDNLAWIAFAFAATLIPIAIAVAISESYIALAALLGMLLNREMLMRHQKAGLFVALSSAVGLAAIVS